MPSAVQQISVQKEYEKNPDISPDDIRKLRKWLETQPHLPGQFLTDLDLVLVYHCCERSAEVSKQVLDLHYTLRTLFSTFFKDRQLDKKTDLCLDTILYAPLPTPTVRGYHAVYARLLDPDPRKFIFTDAIRTFMMVFDLWQHEEGTSPGGSDKIMEVFLTLQRNKFFLYRYVILIDMDTAVMGHVAKLDVMSVRQVLYFLQECMLVKLKEVHFINAPYFMDKVMMLLKPFMKKSLLDIVQIHQPGSQELYQYVPKEALPKEAGGKYKDHNTIRDELIKRLKTNKQFFKDENQRRVNESLRPNGKTTTVETLFGIQGSFKKLDID